MRTLILIMLLAVGLSGAEKDPNKVPSASFNGVNLVGTLGNPTTTTADAVAPLAGGEGFTFVFKSGRLVILAAGAKETEAIVLPIAGGQRVGDMVKFEIPAAKVTLTLPSGKKGEVKISAEGALREKLTLLSGTLTVVDDKVTWTVSMDAQKPEPKAKEKPAKPAEPDAK